MDAPASPLPLSRTLSPYAGPKVRIPEEREPSGSNMVWRRSPLGPEPWEVSCGRSLVQRRVSHG